VRRTCNCSWAPTGEVSPLTSSPSRRDSAPLTPRATAASSSPNTAPLPPSAQARTRPPARWPATMSVTGPADGDMLAAALAVRSRIATCGV
jgi:hypothetical protein